MASPTPIRLLLATEAEATAAAVSDVIQSGTPAYALSRVRSRHEFLEHIPAPRSKQDAKPQGVSPLQNQADPAPDLILVEENGLPALSYEEVLDCAQSGRPGIPVVVLGERDREQSSIRVLRKGAAEYLRLSQIDRLPSVIERALREQMALNTHLRLEDEVRRAADVMRENQKLVTVGRLAGSIAHEINNPLESITNLLYLMGVDPELSPNLRAYLALAQRELDRVVQISKQTLNFYRETPTPVRVLLQDLIEEVLVLYARRITEKRIEVIRQFQTAETITVFPGEIRQVLSNLITNAIEASSEGGRLYLRVRNSAFWGDSGVRGLRITVADNGSGIPAEVRRRLGEPFFTTKGQSGTGLGLWVTQSIIKRYGGNMLLRSSTGERHGTVFSFLLPTNLRPHAVESGPEHPPVHLRADAPATEDLAGHGSVTAYVPQRASGA